MFKVQQDERHYQAFDPSKVQQELPGQNGKNTNGHSAGQTTATNGEYGAIPKDVLQPKNASEPKSQYGAIPKDVHPLDRVVTRPQRAKTVVDKEPLYEAIPAIPSKPGAQQTQQTATVKNHADMTKIFQQARQNNPNYHPLPLNKNLSAENAANSVNADRNFVDIEIPLPPKNGQNGQRKEHYEEVPVTVATAKKSDYEPMPTQLPQANFVSPQANPNNVNNANYAPIPKGAAPANLANGQQQYASIPKNGAPQNQDPSQYGPIQKNNANNNGVNNNVAKPNSLRAGKVVGLRTDKGTIGGEELKAMVAKNRAEMQNVPQPQNTAPVATTATTPSMPAPQQQQKTPDNELRIYNRIPKDEQPKQPAEKKEHPKQFIKKDTETGELKQWNEQDLKEYHENNTRQAQITKAVETSKANEWEKKAQAKDKKAPEKIAPEKIATRSRSKTVGDKIDVSDSEKKKGGILSFFFGKKPKEDKTKKQQTAVPSSDNNNENGGAKGLGYNGSKQE